MEDIKIPFEGSITELDYRRSQLLHRGSPTTLILVLIFCVSLGIFVAIASLLTSFNGKWLFLLAPIALFFTYLISTPGFRFMFTKAQNYKSNKALQSLISGFITMEGVNFTGAEIKAFIPWKMYLKYKKSPSLVLLYQSEGAYNMFMEEFFKTEDEWQEFVQLIEKTVPAR